MDTNRSRPTGSDAQARTVAWTDSQPRHIAKTVDSLRQAAPLLRRQSSAESMGLALTGSRSVARRGKQALLTLSQRPPDASPEDGNESDSEVVQTSDGADLQQQCGSATLAIVRCVSGVGAKGSIDTKQQLDSCSQDTARTVEGTPRAGPEPNGEIDDGIPLPPGMVTTPERGIGTGLGS